jgi:hypothetical protein
MSRRYRGCKTVTVDVDVDIDEFDDEVLLDECKARGLTVPGHMDAIRDAHEALSRGRPAEAKSILERVLVPKWRDPDECHKHYMSFLKNPETKGDLP